MQRRLLRPVIFIFLATAIISLPGHAADETLVLPELGTGAANVISPVEAQALGQVWLRSFRASVPVYEDPIVYEYLENLLLNLDSHSEARRQSLDLVVVKNDSINAFAVPGGVIGVHTGLIEQAQSEAQLASVLAHELAHLSQDHFSRSVEAAKRASISSITGLLAGIALAAAGEGNAATAAIVSGQAAALDSRLRYSRNHEREADRLGTQTLINAGYDPFEAANMFKQMQNIARLYGSKTPEFLLTHPVTESRIAEAESRARQSQQRGEIDSLDFQLIKARISVASFGNPRTAIAHFNHLLDELTKQSNGPTLTSDDNSTLLIQHEKEAAQYGLALSHLLNGSTKPALQISRELSTQSPHRIIYQLLFLDANLQAGNTEYAITELSKLSAITPNNYPVFMALANALMKQKQYDTAAKTLQRLAKARPKQPDIWYLLAEVQGLNGDILGLHQSRAEFFQLNGQYNYAIKHLNIAYKIADGNFQAQAKIKSRLQQVAALKQTADGFTS